MPSCREVADALAGDDVERRGALERLLIRWHLFRCRDCRRYLEQLRAIGRGARDAFRSPAEHSAALDRLRERILRGDGNAERP